MQVVYFIFLSLFVFSGQLFNSGKSLRDLCKVAFWEVSVRKEQIHRDYAITLYIMLMLSQVLHLIDSRCTKISMESLNSKTETNTLVESVAAVAYGGLGYVLERVKDAALGGGWAEAADAVQKVEAKIPSAIQGVGIPDRPHRPRAV